jgi:hypothetical protein
MVNGLIMPKYRRERAECLYESNMRGSPISRGGCAIVRLPTIRPRITPLRRHFTPSRTAGPSNPVHFVP